MHDDKMIHTREVLVLGWLQPTGYQATSILIKMAAEEPLYPHLGRDFLVLNDCISPVQRSCLIKEPNVNDRGFISY